MTETKKSLKRPRGKAQLIEGKCIACGARCQSACPVNCVEMTEAGEPIIDQPKCIGCLKCVKICPAEAIEMVFTPEEQKLENTCRTCRPERSSRRNRRRSRHPCKKTCRLQRGLGLHRTDRRRSRQSLLGTARQRA